MSSEDDDDFLSNDDSNNDEDDDEVMNQQQVRRGATPRALTGRTTQTTSTSPARRQQQQQRQQYTAAEIDREIAGDNDDSDDDNSNNISNEGSNDGDNYDDDDDDDDRRNHARNKRGKAKAKQLTVATPKKRIRKSGYKPITKKPKLKSAKRMKASKPKQRRVESSDDDSEEEEDDEDDENFNVEDESDEEDDNNSDDSDSDYGTSSKKTPTRAKRGSIGGSRRGGHGASGARVTRSTSTNRPTDTRSSSARNRQNQRLQSNSSSNSSDNDDDDDDYEGQSGGGRGRGRGGRPRRACKTQTELRMSEMVHRDMQSEKEAWRGVLEEDDRELLGLEAGRADNNDDDDDDSRNDEDNDVVNEMASSTATGTKRATPNKCSIHDDDDDEDYDEDGNPSDANEDDDEDEDAGEDDVISDDELISQQNQRPSRRNGQKTKNVDLSDEEIGTADEDSEDEETGPGILMSPARKASASRMGGTYYDCMGSSGRSPNASKSRARARMGREPLNVHDGDEDEEEEDDSHGHVHQSTSPHSATTSSTRKKSMEVAMASHINCPSTTDDITMANLPRSEPHVCYISPDGKTRHCFALDTLYRIAISAASNRTGGGGGGIDDNNHGSAQKLTFLQPPHFRSPMEDDLLDQIASRFGRAALIIEKSAIYKKMHGSIFSLNDDDELDDFDEDGEFIGYTNNNNNNNHSSRRGNFQDRFERFIQGLMGSNDVYCCPLCYKEADRRLGNMGDEEMCEDDADDDDEDETEEGHQHSGEECFSFMDDPMRILGSLDQDQYEVASTFCFRTLVDVKTHLKVVHQANIKEVSGNDLYHRFQIRASDGLLQSWLKRNLGKSTVQGDMMRYWSQGENQSFVLLLSQIEKRRYEGEISDEYGIDFCQSFPNRARRVWRVVSAPYSKDQHDMGDFIAAEGEEEESEEDDDDGTACLTPRDAHGEGSGSLESPEDQMIEFLQKKQKSNKQKQSFLKRKANSSDEENSSDASSSDDDELEVLPKPQQFEEVEEEDEWTKSKSLKAKKGQKNMKSTSNSDDDSGDANVFGSDMEQDNTETKFNGSARKRVIDDDNSFGSDTDRNKSNRKSPASNGDSARKKVIESSDEDSF